VLRKVIARL